MKCVKDEDVTGFAIAGGVGTTIPTL